MKPFFCLHSPAYPALESQQMAERNDGIIGRRMKAEE
jgi:hypothetical protein